jgi:hypothetical protein
MKRWGEKRLLLDAGDEARICHGRRSAWQGDSGLLWERELPW